jgi:ribosomal protein S1
MASTPMGKKLEEEIAAAVGDASFDDLLIDQPKNRIKRGSREIKSGIVVAIHGSNILVEFGPRLQGCCPTTQFEELPQIGGTLEFVIEHRDQDDMLVLSRKGAVQKAAWDSLEVGQVVEARCTGTNKGGLELELAGHTAFMPAGQVALHHVEDLTGFIGDKFPCEVIELDRKKTRIVLSRKRILQIEKEEAGIELLSSLSVGDTLEATITTIQAYGAFADIGGIDGLIHISEMAWDRVKDVSKIVKVGQVVLVMILNIDQDHSPPRIALGMKQLLKNPDTTLASSQIEEDTPPREEDKAMRKLREKFGNDPLKGGIG